MRCPLFVGVPQGVAPASLLPDATRVRASTAGGWWLQKGEHVALALDLGTRAFGATTYRVFVLLVVAGDQRAVYRWLDAQPQIAGPYDLSTLPAAGKTMLRELSARRALDGSIISLGPICSPRVWAGEVLSEVDSHRYQLGAASDGSQDQIVSV